MDHTKIQNVALKITCIKVLDLEFLNIISFNYIAQQSAAAPSIIWFLSLGCNPWSQEPNKSAKLVGGWKSKSDMHSKQSLQSVSQRTNVG